MQVRTETGMENRWERDGNERGMGKGERGMERDRETEENLQNRA
jgi:hypothetical protein